MIEREVKPSAGEKFQLPQLGERLGHSSERGDLLRRVDDPRAGETILVRG